MKRVSKIGAFRVFRVKNRDGRTIGLLGVPAPCRFRQHTVVESAFIRPSHFLNPRTWLLVRHWILADRPVTYNIISSGKTPGPEMAGIFVFIHGYTD